MVRTIFTLTFIISFTQTALATDCDRIIKLMDSYLHRVAVLNATERAVTNSDQLNDESRKKELATVVQLIGLNLSNAEKLSTIYRNMCK
jgi:hypothetical protein